MVPHLFNPLYTAIWYCVTLRSVQDSDKMTFILLKSTNHHDRVYIEGILPKGPYPPCLRMADRALLAGYPRHETVYLVHTDGRSHHYANVIMIVMASQITSLAIVYSIVYSDADQRKHQSSASLAFVRGIHRGPVNSRTNRQLRGKCFHLMSHHDICDILHLM